MQINHKNTTNKRHLIQNHNNERCLFMNVYFSPSFGCLKAINVDDEKKNPSAYCYSTQTIAITTVRCKWAVLTVHTESRNV